MDEHTVCASLCQSLSSTVSARSRLLQRESLQMLSQSNRNITWSTSRSSGNGRHSITGVGPPLPICVKRLVVSRRVSSTWRQLCSSPASALEPSHILASSASALPSKELLMARAAFRKLWPPRFPSRRKPFGPVGPTSSAVSVGGAAEAAENQRTRENVFSPIHLSLLFFLRGHGKKMLIKLFP